MRIRNASIPTDPAEMRVFGPLAGGWVYLLAAWYLWLLIQSYALAAAPAGKQKGAAPAGAVAGAVGRSFGTRG
jgi:hypothetical protein